MSIHTACRIPSEQTARRAIRAPRHLPARERRVRAPRAYPRSYLFVTKQRTATGESARQGMKSLNALIVIKARVIYHRIIPKSGFAACLLVFYLDLGVLSICARNCRANATLRAGRQRVERPLPEQNATPSPGFGARLGEKRVAHWLQRAIHD